MYSIRLEPARKNAPLRIVWVHGWRSTGKSMLPLAGSFLNQTENYLVDLPGFGKSPAPTFAYSSEDYADCVADLIKSLPPRKTALAGHSAGGRIVIAAAKKYPEIIQGIILIGGAGIPPRRPPLLKFYIWLVGTLSPAVKKIFPFLRDVTLRTADHRMVSGIMREILIKLINEDLRNVAKSLDIPALLIYGDRDEVTPPYMGHSYNELIRNSALRIIRGANHIGLLTDFTAEIHHHINAFLRENLC
ncbi:MAG: alpha/beta hydrolase [Rickettsiales bacterium]|jgi:pimeloyl-ACP methyl ester carboxylesterase|nr:alpha/beta hydrolase [Rickettsiales bacterium]